MPPQVVDSSSSCHEQIDRASRPFVLRFDDLDNILIDNYFIEVLTPWKCSDALEELGWVVVLVHPYLCERNVSRGVPRLSYQDAQDTGCMMIFLVNCMSNIVCDTPFSFEKYM